MKRSASQSGFTLLEVLIAAVLLGSVFVAVVSVMSQSLRNIDRMRPHETAILHAREKMNDKLLLDELVPGSSTGEWLDGYRWNVDVTPLDFVALGRSTAAPQSALPLRPDSNVQPGVKTLFRVKVTVDWDERDSRHTYDLETMQWAMWPTPKS